ncbi:allophanate hydrolase-related protein [Tsukamurella soli]|uniref:Allophanate hydrolase C-terminal domain-containing protein n=1 Tax=Tsukamurella soli TaxID=644556 RepID=A0ABP8JDX2_9ACTN
MVHMFLNGQAMEGGPFHKYLNGAPLVARTTTAPGYRLRSFGDVFPGMWPDPSVSSTIAGEVYELPEAVLRDELLPNEPPELELGLIRLGDGSAAFSMLLRPEHREHGGTREITSFGGWRAYLQAIESADPG